MSSSAKIKFFSILISVLAMGSSFAFDFGGLVTNDTIIKTCEDSKFRLDQKNSASLWLRQSISEDGSSYFAAETIYSFERDFNVDSPVNVLDVDLCKLVLKKPVGKGSLGISAGRFYYSDLTGTIYNQLSDGIEFLYESPVVQVTVYGAYTGLLNAQNAKMISSDSYTNMAVIRNKSKLASLKRDRFITEEAGSLLSMMIEPSMPIDKKYTQLDSKKMATPLNLAVVNKLTPASDAFYLDPDRVYDAAEKYAVGSIAIGFPGLIKTQSLSAQFIGAFRLEKSSFNRMYAILAAEGPIVHSLYYGVNTSFGFAQYDGSGTEVSNLSKAGLVYYSNFKSASIGLSGVYASCAQGGLENFHGITQVLATYSLRELQHTGLVKVGLTASIKPVDSVIIIAGCDCVASAHDSDELDTFSYSGMQYAAGVKWQAKSDLMFAASVTQYLSKESSDDMDKTAFSLSAALSF